MSFPLVSLGDFVKIARNGITPEKIQSGANYVGLENIDGSGNFIDVKGVDAGELASSKFLFTKKQVLFGKLRPYLKKIARPDFDGICSTDILPLLPSKEIDRDYLFHTLRRQSFVDDVSSLSSGANLPRISPKVLSEMQIPLPALEEQRRIATVLDKADALRAQRRAAIAKFDDLLQSVFIEMFGDPIINPKAWVKVPIGSVADISTGSTPSRTNKDYYGGQIPWVKTTEIIGEAIVDTEEKLTIEGLRAIRGKLHPKGSVIVAMYGQGQTRGRCGLLMIEASCNQACGVIRPSKSFNSVFLLWQLRLGYERLRELGRGGNQENLNLQLLGGFEVLLPPLEIQERFADVARKIEAQKQTMQRAAEKTEALFASLQQRAFSGKL